MPALFNADSYDFAGYCIGIVEHELVLGSNRIEEGDIILGLPANGFHCSGYDIIFNAMRELKEDFKNTAPFSKSAATYGRFQSNISC